MSRQEWASEGWFYKQAGVKFGPVSTERLQELLDMGLLQPRQAVWKKDSHSLHFVHAATAGCETKGEVSQSLISEPVSV